MTQPFSQPPVSGGDRPFVAPQPASTLGDHSGETESYTHIVLNRQTYGDPEPIIWHQMGELMTGLAEKYPHALEEYPAGPDPNEKIFITKATAMLDCPGAARDSDIFPYGFVCYTERGCAFIFDTSNFRTERAARSLLERLKNTPFLSPIVSGVEESRQFALSPDNFVQQKNITLNSRPGDALVTVGIVFLDVLNSRVRETLQELNMASEELGKNPEVSVTDVLVEL